MGSLLRPRRVRAKEPVEEHLDLDALELAEQEREQFAALHPGARTDWDGRLPAGMVVCPECLGLGLTSPSRSSVLRFCGACDAVGYTGVPVGPTSLQPGTPAKVAVLAARYRRGEELSQPGDRTVLPPSQSTLSAFAWPDVEVRQRSPSRRHTEPVIDAPEEDEDFDEDDEDDEELTNRLTLLAGLFGGGGGAR